MMRVGIAADHGGFALKAQLAELVEAIISPGRRTVQKLRSRVRILPSILTADFFDIANEIRTVESAGAHALHLDSMDGQFVPNLSSGLKVVADLRKLTNCDSTPTS